MPRHETSIEWTHFPGYRRWDSRYNDLIRDGMRPGTRLHERVNSLRFMKDARTHNFGPLSVCRVGKKYAGRLLDGVEHNGFPNIAGAPC